MKRYLLILVSIGILFSFCSCSNGSKNTASNGKAETKPPINSQYGKAPSFITAKLLPSQLVSQDKAVTLENCTYQIKKVSISKKLTGFQKDNIEYYKITADDSGNLTSAHSYIYIDLTAKNVLAKEITVCFTTMKIVTISTDNIPDQTLGSDLKCFDKSQHEDSRSYGIYKFKPNEETTFRFVFIVPDNGLKTNLYLEVNPTGESEICGSLKQYNPDVKRFIKLKIS